MSVFRMSPVPLFVPHVDGEARIVREAYLTRDNTMPRRDWSRLDRPAAERIDARTVCAGNFSSLRKAG